MMIFLLYVVDFNGNKRMFHFVDFEEDALLVFYHLSNILLLIAEFYA